VDEPANNPKYACILNYARDQAHAQKDSWDNWLELEEAFNIRHWMNLGPAHNNDNRHLAGLSLQCISERTTSSVDTKYRNDDIHTPHFEAPVHTPFSVSVQCTGMYNAYYNQSRG
jgi:hypothetical protein